MRKRNIFKRCYKGLCVFCAFVFVIALIACDKKEYTDVDSGIKTQYILNTNSKKIHKENCGTATLIHAKNRKQYEGEIEYLLNRGYTVCGNCFS